MTKRAEKGKKTKFNRGQLSRAELLFCIMSIFALCLTFLYSDVAISSMGIGIKLCIQTVIPSLFPFMVISELFIASGASSLLARILGRPLSRIFGISREGSSAVLLGFLCGFPIGTKSAISLFERGKISKSELEHICAFSNNPSSAFLISAVGITLFGSKEFGILLYVLHLLSSSAVGIVLGIYYKKKRGEECSAASLDKPRGFVSAFGDAVGSSARSTLYICAFVVFFSAVVGYLRLLCNFFGLPTDIQVLILGFFEMTSGVAAAAALPSLEGAAMAALICGWSGLSVHFQLVGICREQRISLKPYIFSKLACSVMNFAFVLLSLRFLSDKIRLLGGASISSILEKRPSAEALWVLLVFCAASLLSLARLGKHKF